MSGLSPYVGDSKSYQFTFRVDDVPTDPSAVSVSVKSSSGIAVYTYNPGTITKVSTGVYRLSFTIIDDGQHTVVFSGTGSAAKIEVITFSARKNPLT